MDIGITIFLIGGASCIGMLTLVLTVFILHVIISDRKWRKRK